MINMFWLSYICILFPIMIILYHWIHPISVQTRFIIQGNAEGGCGLCRKGVDTTANMEWGIQRIHRLPGSHV